MKKFKSMSLALMALLAIVVVGCKTEADSSSAVDLMPPAKVTIAEDGVTAANGKAVLTWTNPADKDFYATRVTVTPTVENGNSSLVIEGKAGEKSSASFEGLVNGTEYTFKLCSMDKSHNASEAVEVKATPKASEDSTAPAEVTNLSVSFVNGKDGKVNAALTWTDPIDTDLFGMEVTYVKDSSSRAAIATMAQGSIFVAPGNGGVVITDLTAGTTYTFTVKTMDTNGNKSSGESKTKTMSLSQLSELKITLTASTTEITNQDVTITVKAESSSAVSKIYYISGIKTSVNDVLKGTEITSSASFTATENGTYTVAVVDYDGRRELSYITISNIDKAAPNKSANLAASYDYGKKTITVTWNSSDSDVDHYLVSYTKAGTDVVTDEKVTEKSYTVSSVEVGTTEEEYAFTVKPVDKAGNTGSEATTSVTPKAAPLVSKIELSRTHFAYKEAGTTFTATVYGSNFDLISDQTDTTVKVQILDSDGNVESTTTATSVDTTSNTATATLILPTLTSSTAAGTNYTVRAKVCGSIDKEHTTTFNISEAAEVTDVTLSTSLISVNSVTSDTKTKATVTGTNLDLAKTITLFLYDSTGKKYGEEVSVDLTKFTQSTASFDIDLPVPTVDDLYKVRVVLEGWTYRSKTTSLQVYGLPAFTSFDIPNAGTVKEDNTVTATVIGKNFTAPGVSATDFSLSCASNKNIVSDPNITIESDSKLTVTLTIPGTVGSYDVVIASGNNSMTGTFTVKDSKGYALGDVILKDGTKVDAKAVSSTTFATTGDKVPVAVAVVNENGVGICFLGLKKSSSSLSWAKENTTGYNTSFTDIIGWRGGGDMDGSANWEYICSEDPEGTKDAATNYPAFDFAANYGTTTCGFDENDEFASGWYIPSASELYEIYKCKDTLQTSLNNVGGFTIAKTDMYSYRYQYWSSSQSSANYYYAYYVDFSSGNVYYNYKSNGNYVLVVRQF